jgi:hypothetical protein
VVSGLCATQGDVAQLFAVVDAVVEEMEKTGPSDIERVVYEAHGRFLNVLAHLNGEAPHLWPPIPATPTWESKHAPHAKQVPTTNPPVASAKGKQRAVDPSLSPLTSRSMDATSSPLFLPSPSYDVEESEEVSSSLLPPQSVSGDEVCDPGATAEAGTTSSGDEYAGSSEEGSTEEGSTDEEE